MKKKKHTKLSEWQDICKNGNEKCAKCGEKNNLTVDHIVPTHWIEQFIVTTEQDIAYEFEKNFQILCRYCNQMKAGRIDPKDPRVYEILEYIIKEAKAVYLPV